MYSNIPRNRFTEFTLGGSRGGSGSAQLSIQSHNVPRLSYYLHRAGHGLAVPVIGACADCNRLWQEYSAQRAAYVDIVMQIQQATIDWNLDALAILEIPQSEAGERCTRARQAFKDHEREDHEALADGKSA